MELNENELDLSEQTSPVEEKKDSTNCSRWTLSELLEDEDLTEEEKLMIFDNPDLYESIKYKRKRETHQNQDLIDGDIGQEGSISLLQFIAGKTKEKVPRLILIISLVFFTFLVSIIFFRFQMQNQAQQGLQSFQEKVDDLVSRIETYSGNDIDSEVVYVQLRKELNSLFESRSKDVSYRHQWLYLRALLGSKNSARLQEALSDMESLIKEAERDNTLSAKYFYLRGMIYRKLKQYQEAIADFNRALEIDPYDWRSLIARADIYNEQKDFNNAILDYTRALSLLSGKGHHPRAYYGLALAYLGQGNLELAVLNLREAKRAAQETNDLILYQEADQLILQIETTSKQGRQRSLPNTEQEAPVNSGISPKVD